MVDQKVFALLNGQTTITNVSEDTKNIMEMIGDYTGQSLAIEASICGYSFAFVEQHGRLKFKVFDTEECIPFVDPWNLELRALIRTWKDFNSLTYTITEYAEVYEKEQYTLYRKDGDKYSASFQMAYKQQLKKDAIEEVTEDLHWKNGLPILFLKNNKDYRSDFTRSIRSQIDSIDIVMSDFANNLSDFQDVYWIVKGLDEITAEQMGDFMNTLKNTYKAVLPEGADATPQQIQIPFEARKEFVTMVKKQLIANAGTIDNEFVLSGGLTATAINVATQKLKMRVAKFEYNVKELYLQMIRFVKEYTEDTTEELPRIVFSKEFIENSTEIINNLVLSSSMLSNETMLEQHPYVKNVQLELERLEEESSGKYTLDN